MKKSLVIIGAIAAAIVLAGTAYRLLTYYDNNFRYGRMWETPAIRPHEKPIAVMEAGVVPAKGGEAFFRAVPEEELKSPLQPAREDIEKGKVAYTNFCAQCHGKDYDGFGTVGQSFSPLPTDLRSPRVQNTPDGTLFKHMSYGVPGGRQPALAGTIRVPERWQIIAYIRSLGVR
ncbi:MAG: hypothetical protein C4530_12500 [Desulfobacteraceae bacterium]|nr:MAG: hypothetical protein C4530_12500 [Desulfobacteraceae bacterium]